jgi:hypothetical protein
MLTWAINQASLGSGRHPNPPKPPLGPLPSFTEFNFEKYVVEISLDSIKRIKDHVASETNQKCSTFDVVTAIMFKCRASAIDFAPDVKGSPGLRSQQLRVPWWSYQD